MSPKLPRVTGKDMVRFLQAEGFQVIRITGSHYVLSRQGRIVVVPVHAGETLGVGITQKILKQSGVPVEKFREWFT